MRSTRGSEKRKVVENSLDLDFSDDCLKKFKSDPVNRIVRNAIVTVGSNLATTNQDELNKLTHLFMNSVKKKNLKATDQGRSGRCWCFSAFNILRHILIKAMDLDKFEFSGTYLYFWDKFERSNTYLQWFIDNSEFKAGDRHFDFMVSDFLSDGGWFNTFANLIEKYGMVPKDVMDESFQSSDTDDMNEVLGLYLNSAVNYICKNRNTVSNDDLLKYKKEVMENIFNILIKYLGTPPQTFNWAFNKGDEVSMVTDLSPMKFKDMVMPNMSMHDFVVVADLPHLPRNKMYVVNYSSNVYEGKKMSFLNLPIEDIAKYSEKCIVSGCSVWFACDVRKHFNFYHSTLCDKVNNTDDVFGKYDDMTKGEALLLRSTEPNHAMALTGVNVNSEGDEPTSWQVENSWGYFDHETEGLDGFLYMSHSWFKKYVIEISIFGKMLSDEHLALTKTTPVELLPWEVGGAASMIKGVKKPLHYKDSLRKKIQM